MHNQTVLQSSAPGELFTLAGVKDWLKVEHSSDDALITSLITAARSTAEMFLRRSLTPKSYAWIGAQLADFIALPYPALRAVDAVRYYAPQETTLATVDADTYTVCIDTSPGIVQLAEGATWPTTALRVDAVRITYRAACAYPCALPEGSPADAVRVPGHALRADDVVHYYAFDGDPWSGLEHGGVYTVASAADGLVTLRDSVGAIVQPSAGGGGEPAVHWLGTIEPVYRLAMLQAIASWYDHRASLTSQDMSQLPDAARWLLHPHRCLEL